jgi:Trk-type K+ transport system membrane component
MGVNSAIFKLPAPPAVMVRSHYAINTHFYQLVVNFHGGKMFFPYKQITFSDFLKDHVSSATVTAHQLIPGMESD